MPTLQQALQGGADDRGGSRVLSGWWPHGQSQALLIRVNKQPYGVTFIGSVTHRAAGRS